MKFLSSPIPLTSVIFGFLIIFLIFTIPSVDAQNERITQLEEQLRQNPNNLETNLTIAEEYFKADMCDKAMVFLDKILEINPAHSNALFGKALCFNQLGEPENALLILDNLSSASSNKIGILNTKANSHTLLKEFEKAEKYYKLVLESDPDNKNTIYNLVLLSWQMKDSSMSEYYLVKLLGNNPTPSQLDPGVKNFPFTFPINDSEKYTASVQIQVRNSSDELIAVVESETILYTAHPLIEKLIHDSSSYIETIENDSGTYEVRKIVERSIPIQNAYFMDRTEFSHNGYLVFFAYNLAVPLESGDYIINEWLIKKKI